MIIFNYIRVSTVQQNTDRQLLNVPCDRIYEEKLSGKDINRPQLQALLQVLLEAVILTGKVLTLLLKN